ncbi:uncharacterized protein L969DRAFT_86229 [Mixia osmundae IAM 14324]|uniref:Methyltransferase domain-containing protein n=1 Tax=Mixia osmundae (strain CBS 9802 / IAM 14324 / JCM 22182 / KY 12970) TaxID=764103 RepID=G7DU64_MIXOS|nr:uncharacterized protein L969DRAFT_86229 [Mixia osmundae IAM 14324]KEI40991.1 hypothetical protein L969DRAFT_86229 [Mixia osmundae IAM 14324]GAA94124.1 hypothetical protein E5Q_00772 [Mixia osmundae IAM 14324]
MLLRGTREILPANAPVQSFSELGIRDPGERPENQRMRQLVHSPDGWDKAWQAGSTPWDNNDIQPGLSELLEELPIGKTLGQPGKTAIIPGCGRGYDVAAIAARYEMDCVGLDISPTAVEAAKVWYAAQPNLSDRVRFQCGNFFDFEVPDDKFALAYEYTFLCALPPSMRKAWGQRFSEIMAPGGHLIALVFPMDGDRAGGPPYSVDLDLFDELLPDFEKIHQSAPSHPAPGRERREMITVWKRK